MQTGTAIIEAILKGERKPEKFMLYIDKRIKADKKTIMKSLEGNWREEHLTTLRLSYEIYKNFQLSIGDCEKEIEKALQEYESHEENKDVTQPTEEIQKETGEKKKRTKSKRSPSIDTRT